MAAPATSSAPADRPPAANPPESAAGFRHYRRFQAQLRLAGQFCAGLLALWLAVTARDWLPQARQPMDVETFAACLIILLGALAAGAVARRRGSHLRRHREPVSIAMATVVVLVALFFFRSLGVAVSRPTVLFFAVFATIALAGWDFASRYWLPRATQVRNIVLVGVEGGSAEFAFASGPAAGPWRVAAQIEETAATGAGKEAALERLRNLVRHEPIDEILITSSIWEAGTETRGFFQGVAELCEQTGVRLHVHAQWLTGYRQVHIDYLGDCPIVTFSFSARSPWLLALKRAGDLVFSALLLVVLSPLLAMLAVAVKLDSPGPALFSQTRCGLRGRSFQIYKFRSMMADAEAHRDGLAAANEMTGPVFKVAHDPRITRAGHWLRKTSLDELPQLWNVLRGDMSLVGPRPPLPEEVRVYHLDSLHRLAMKPGMTGLWQVSGRSAIRDFAAWVALDARYIREWSPWLDCKILLRTIGVLARMNGQ